jgi:hypothetical protein
MATDTKPTDFEEYRADTFLRIGFDESQAAALAGCRGLDGFYLSHHDVSKYLKNGATHEQVLRIFMD